jgi:hypothetical protein
LQREKEKSKLQEGREEIRGANNTYLSIVKASKFDWRFTIEINKMGRAVSDSAL